jgi:branched-chain amino acid transport system ATP-binding protein
MPKLLEVCNLHAWYGESHVLHGMRFEVNEGEVVTLIGRNGAGKTSMLRAIMNSDIRRTGSIRINGAESIDTPPHRIPHLGVAWCPEERGIFSSLSVMENLTLPPVLKSGGMSTKEVLELFPRLRERAGSPGTTLSGGEQQMLAIARILRSGARLLLLDEPTEGLAPVIVKQIGDIICVLRERGYTILLVEQNLKFAARCADRHYLIEHGQVVDCIASERFSQERSRVKECLGV